MRGNFFLILLILAGLSAEAQHVRKPFIIESKIHAGLNLPFYKALDYLIEEDLYAFDISFSFPASGKDQWEKLYHYPRPGFGYSFWTLGNRDILGNAHAIYGFISIPVIRKSQKISFNVQPSAGAAIIPLKFDVYENHLNRAIGSSSNLYIRLGFDARVKLTSRTEFIMEAGTTHFSNGKTRSPNYGINTASISLGMNYLFNHNNFQKSDPEIPPISKKLMHSVIFSAGPKVYDNLLNNRYVSSTLSYNLERYVNHTGKAGLGADIFYDGSIAEGLAEKEGLPIGNDPVKLMRFGIHGSYALRYKRFQGGVQAGYYLYSKFTVLTNIYNKISLQYLFTDNICASVSVRSHWGKADAIEYGLGYAW
ncbi:MAG: acyloxyacyl hydrolase [Chloroflexota bacterium]